jgi:hypothetical protein
MSHISQFEFQCSDLDALEKAAEACGCELVRGQKKYKWFGRFVGDSPMPKGLTEADLGKCDHAIRVKGASSQTYEVGVCKTEDGKFALRYDFWSGGYGLVDKVGKDGKKLELNYNVHHAKNFFEQQGYYTNIQTNQETGNPQLVAEKF